jgi:phospholipid/cholesterol/gamma-HCH transport system permease protein
MMAAMTLANSLSDLLTRRGATTLNWLRGWWQLIFFASRAVIEALTPSTYNSATRSVVQKQIYFTAWQILPGYTLFSALLSIVLIRIVTDTSRNFGLADYALEMTIRAYVLEILPLITALFVALRSGAAINTEVVLMNIHNEIKAFEDVGIDTMRLEFIPRVIGGTVSVMALSAVSSGIALVIAYLTVYGFNPWNLPNFSQVLGQVFDGTAIALLWGKVLFFGLAVTVIPISAGLAAPQKLFFAPIAVLHGMVRLFFVLMLVEVLSLAIHYS